MRSALLLLPLLACTPSAGEETDPTGGDADTDSDTDADTDTDTDTQTGDVTPPSLPGTSGADYTLYYDGASVLVYWRAASDDVTAAGDLEYAVYCLPDGADGETVSLDWTAGSALPVEGSGRLWWIACAAAPGRTYDVWVAVRDEAGNTSSWPTLELAVPAADTTPPSLPALDSFSYTTYLDGREMNVYWTAASDDHTAAADLEYMVTAVDPSGSASTPLPWTPATALSVEGSGRYWAVVTGAPTAGEWSVTVHVRDEAGNVAEYPALYVFVPYA